MIILVDGEPLDLPTGFAMTVEDTSPIFNDRGSQSLPATVPATRRNRRLLGHPDRPDGAGGLTGISADVCDGAYRRRGPVNITSAGRTAGITLNVGFDNSTAYAEWTATRLRELPTLPRTRYGSPVGLAEYMWRLYRYPRENEDPLAVFPVAIAREEITEGDSAITYWEMLNLPAPGGGFGQPSKVKRVIDGTVTEVTVPDAYGLSPFVRVWRLVELAFAALGVEPETNIFRTDRELRRLVVLNNTADAACTGTLAWADLVPDCTVGEFMDSLWVRFGLVYDIDCDTRRVKLRLIRDIIASGSGADVMQLASTPPLMTDDTPQYVRLSASTSLDGAAPPTERFEDFVRGHDLARLHMGADIRRWQYLTGNAGQGWDGDDRGEDWGDYDPDYPDPQYPEPDYPEPDYPDYPDYAPARSMAAAEDASGEGDTFLAREYVTGTWFKLDAGNKAVKVSGSGFFNWDPATPGLTAFELTSVDECVPVEMADNSGTGTGNAFKGYCPMFLAGSRHFHSYVRGSEDAEEEDTPLAYALAFPVDGGTAGRISPEGEDGKSLKLSDGTVPSLSLLFQFADGLFARYWSGFDEILRHAGRRIEVEARMPKPMLRTLDMTLPVMFGDVRCLPDTLTYDLPAGRTAAATLTLRTLTTHGEYDIEAEQGVPEFGVGAATRVIRWTVETDTLADVISRSTNRAQAAQQWRDANDYQSHGGEGDFWTVDWRGAVPSGFTRGALYWGNDPGVNQPSAAGMRMTRTYKATARYAIYEVHDTAVQGAPEEWDLPGNPLGEFALQVDYQVTLVAVWGLA